MAKPRSITRRTALAGLSAGGLGMALASTGGQASAQMASPESSTSPGIVGTWVVTFEAPPLPPAVVIFGADGSFIDAAGGHAGVWEAAGQSTFSHTWIHVYGNVPNDFGQSNNYVAVSGTIELDETGDSWSESFTRMVVGADGTVLGTGKGKVHATRLHAVPEDQIGDPLEIVPTWTSPMATPS